MGDSRLPHHRLASICEGIGVLAGSRFFLFLVHRVARLLANRWLRLFAACPGDAAQGRMREPDVRDMFAVAFDVWFLHVSAAACPGVRQSHS